jgi:carbon storage regulator
VYAHTPEAAFVGKKRLRGTPGQSLKERFMLVLSRKKNESIVINDDITIVVVEIRGDKVRLGVEAPKEVPVHRREVFDAIHRNESPSAAEPAEKTGGNGGQS